MDTAPKVLTIVSYIGLDIVHRLWHLKVIGDVDGDDLESFRAGTLERPGTLPVRGQTASEHGVADGVELLGQLIAEPAVTACQIGRQKLGKEHLNKKNMQKQIAGLLRIKRNVEVIHAYKH